MKIHNGWLASASVRKSPNFDERPEDMEVDLLVIHNISLPPAQFDNDYVALFFENKLPLDDDPYFSEIGALKVSSHFLIKRTGEVLQFVSCDDRAWHAGKSSFQGRERCNDFSIGIELEGTDDLAYEDIQYQVLVDLTLSIQQAYPRITCEKITGHCDIAPGRKTDPGSSFDWRRYLDLIESRA